MNIDSESQYASPLSDVKRYPSTFTRYQYEAMKSRETDLTELPDHSEFTEWVLKTKVWHFPYSDDPAKGRVECRLSYDGTIKTCCLTGHSFIAPVPLAFFHEGDLDKPVSPHEALRNGFVMDHLAFFAICWSLCNEDDLRHWIPMAYAWAERNDQTWISDYGQFCWNPGEVIDDYFDMHLEGFKPLLDAKKRGEPLPKVNGTTQNSAKVAEVTKQH